MIQHIDSLDEFKQALTEAGSNLVVIDFFVPWCGNCKMIAPFFLTLSQKYQDVLFLKVDVDDAEDVAIYCDVTCMPTFQFYKNGERVDEFSGANRSVLEDKIKELR
ncbi:thioredoxin-like [Discoglossus pictus]